MTYPSQHELLRALPQVEALLHTPGIESLQDELPQSIIVDAIRRTIDDARGAIISGKLNVVDQDTLIFDVQLRARTHLIPSLKPVINASGVVIHTNLGRSALADEAIHAATKAAQGYSTLEYDTENRARGSRHTHIEQLICSLTGAEAAIAVNNNAAAVLMVLSVFAENHEAVVSRGELVEIGGSFRIPDIMSLSHASMVEVGTTNKTHLSDYTGALTENTAMLLKVHPSNYRLVGFTESVDVAKLRKVADAENLRRKKLSLPPHIPNCNKKPDELLVYEDQGSGALIKLTCFGNYAEPTVADSIAHGCDLVSFSGDKLLGGPQAGIIVGKKRHIDRLKNSPLARALRLDKMTLAALEATLRLYLNQKALHSIPTLRMLSESIETVHQRAQTLETLIGKIVPNTCVQVSVVDEIARAGGGALPMCDIPTSAVRVTLLRGNILQCEHYLISKRNTPIIARIKKGALLFDARTLLNKEELSEIARALSEYFNSLAN